MMHGKKLVCLGSIGYILSLCPYGYSWYKNKETPTDYVSTETRSKKEQAIAIAIKDKNLAAIITKTKYPRTIAAIKLVETEYAGPNIYGDKGKSYGLYQIQEHLHGEFEKTLEGQTYKAEEILEDLVRRHGYYEAIKRYNGSGKAASLYRAKVLRKVKEIEQIERNS